MIRKNILLTGSSGFIGKSLLKSLLKNGYNVISIDRNFNYSKQLSNGKYYLIHAGAYILKSSNSIYNAEKSITHNILWTYKLLDQLIDKLSGICYISTADVYGNPTILPIIEDHLTKPITAYAISKLSSEYYTTLLCKNIPTTILRLTNVYGPQDPHPKVIKIFIDNIKNNKSLDIYGDGSDLRDYIHIDDIISIIIKIIDRPISDIFNLASGYSYSIEELAHLVINIAKKTVPIIYHNRINPKIDYIFNTKKLISTFNFQPSNLEYKLREIIQS